MSGKVVVGIRPSLPVEGISFILGNDLAGGKVPVHPQVTPVPMVIDGPDELSQKYPSVFSVCAVTRAMAKRLSKGSLEDGMQPTVVDLSETFMCDVKSSVSKPDKPCLNTSDVFPTSETLTEAELLGPVIKKTNPVVSDTAVPREHLKSEQRKDPSLLPLFEEISNNISEMATGYFLRDGVLMRKWCPPSVPM